MSCRHEWWLGGLLMLAVGCESFVPPPDRSGMYAACCEGLGVCVPSGLVPDALQSMVEPGSCKAALSCVPRDLLNERNAPSQRCTSSLLGAEGRCLPACLPPVAARAAQLAQDGCADHALCVPCFDPASGRPTGACDLGLDEGAEEAPRTFAECCGGAGLCVPQALVPTEYTGLLGADSCSSAERCVAPRELLTNGETFAPDRCIDAAVGAEGRCLPRCLPQVGEQAAGLSRASCDEHSLCVPCFDPVTGDASGACKVGADPGPSEPPTLFTSCCGGAGRCAPKVLVPEGLLPELDQGDCADAADLCVAPLYALQNPRGFRLASCTEPVLSAEGRCVPACLPRIAAQAARLRQASCPADQLCAPCFDPLTGSATGACEINGDAPAQPAKVLDGCCKVDGQSLGVCLPPALASSASATLPQADCEADAVCAPRSLAADPSATLPACRSSVGAGVCLSTCFLAPAQALLFSRGSCAADEDCVPCSLFGLSTGVCEL